MHPATDPSTGEVDTNRAAIEKCAAYPENTVLSLLVIALVAVGALYVVNWSLREEFAHVHRWDFATMADGEGPWTFPKEERGKTVDGMSFVIEGTGPGPMLTMDFDASTLRSIRTTIAITRVADGTPVPFEVEWYWSSPAEVAEAKAAGEWPFSGERGATFVQTDRHNVELRQVDIYKHHLWKGPIARAFIGIKFTSAIPGPFRVETKNIVFLE